MTSPHEIAERQRELNAFAKRYLRGVPPLRVDGEWGPASGSRLARTKYWLGYGKRDGRTWNSAFVRKLRHPHSVRYSPPWQLALGANRRRRQRALAAASHVPASGKAYFDGRPVAAWLLPHLNFARQHGWKGTLVSGYRDPAYSEHLCYGMCGAPRCPGRCAGRSSNHSQHVRPYGAIDVSDYVTFGRLMARDDAPKPRIYNALGAQDPVHFSHAGN